MNMFNGLLLLKVVSVKSSTASMYGTKIEVHLTKAEAGSWPRLELPSSRPAPKEEAAEKPVVDEEDLKVDALDLDDIEADNIKLQLSPAAGGVAR